MVVVAHGGPYGVFEHWGYDAEAALLASQGFTVLRVNFRGSGGYGRAFLEGIPRVGPGHAGRHHRCDPLGDRARPCRPRQGLPVRHELRRLCRADGRDPRACAVSLRGPLPAPYDLAKMYEWGSIRRSDLGLKYLERVLGKDKVS